MNRYDNLHVDELLSIDTALGCIDDPAARGYFLHRLGNLYAFDDLASEAEVLQMVAATEDAIATETELTDGIVLINWFRDGTTVEELRLWRDLGETEDRHTRAEILSRLRPYVAKRAGEIAATQLTSVANWERAVARRNGILRGCRITRVIRRMWRRS